MGMETVLTASFCIEMNVQRERSQFAEKEIEMMVVTGDEWQEREDRRRKMEVPCLNRIQLDLFLTKRQKEGVRQRTQGPILTDLVHNKKICQGLFVTFLY